MKSLNVAEAAAAPQQPLHRVVITGGNIGTSEVLPDQGAPINGVSELTEFQGDLFDTRAQVARVVDYGHQFDQHVAAHNEAQHKQFIAELSNVIFHAENAVHRNNPIQTSERSDWQLAYQAVADFLTQKGYHPDSPGIDYILMDARPTSLGSRFSIYDFLGQWAYSLSHKEVGPKLDEAQTQSLVQALGI